MRAKLRPATQWPISDSAAALASNCFCNEVGPDGTVHGVEIAEDMLTRARERFATEIRGGRLRLAHGSLAALPVKDKTLNAAVTVNTLYFVSDLDAVCTELSRVLRPGARAVVGVGDPKSMARLPFTAYGFTLRSITEIVGALKQAGFRDVEEHHLSESAIPHHLLVAVADG